MDEPLVEILLATHNGERFVSEQIDSIRAQKHKNWRLLISDDCSSDGTLSIIRRYASEDSRICVVSSGVRFGGAKENFFALLSRSEAPYCMFCDQDDVWLPEKISKSLAELQKLEVKYGNDVPLLVFCDMKVVDRGLGIVYDSFERSSNYDPSRLAFNQIIALNVAAGCCQCFNHELVIRSLNVADLTGVEYHDWWAMLVAAAFGDIYFIDEPLSLYRQHGENEVGANSYSPLRRACNQDFMEQQFRMFIAQADLFARTYGNCLSQNDVQAAKDYVKVSRSKSILGGVVCLLKSRCLKPGARKLGQIAMVVRIVISNRKPRFDV